MEITLKFLTPAFLYGADQSHPEFRIPSLIGQMRYWWRMTQDWSNISRLREIEADVFGLNETGAKPFYMYIVNKEVQLTNSIKKNKPVNSKLKHTSPNFDEFLKRFKKVKYDKIDEKIFYTGFMETTEYESMKNFNFQGDGDAIKVCIDVLYKKAHQYFYTEKQDGLAYLFYSFNGRDDSFSWITPGTSTVSIALEFIKPVNEDVLLSLFLLSRFGGLGARSRRGAGAVELSGDKDTIIFDLMENDLLAYICANDAERSSMPGHLYFEKIDRASPLWKALAQGGARFKKSAPSQGWEQALGTVGMAMQNFRTRQGITNGIAAGGVDPEFATEAQKLHQFFSNRTPLPKHLTKDAFGLPRIVNFSTGGHKANALTVAPLDATGNVARRASPLHITVKKIPGGQYYCNLLILWDGIDFLPAGMNINVKKNPKYKPVYTQVLDNPPVDKLVAFLNQI